MKPEATLLKKIVPEAETRAINLRRFMSRYVNTNRMYLLGTQTPN
jgi:hypothetical protein